MEVVAEYARRQLLERILVVRDFCGKEVERLCREHE